MEYQWYPGHMTKTRRIIEEDIRLIDLMIELLDARIPMSSRNPDIDRLSQGKARFIILNKADMADPEATKEWMDYFTSRGIVCVSIDSRNTGDAKKLLPKIMTACREKIERNKRRGIKNRPIRAMVAGIPNVGKSTFINSFAGRKIATTGNKPGVTRGKQWVRLSSEVELLDTPGILWPKFEDQSVGEKLAMIGAIKENVIPTEEIAVLVIKTLNAIDRDIVTQRYDIEYDDEPAVLLENIGRKRGCLIKGGEVDLYKASKILWDEFKNGKLGRFTLEKPVTKQL